VPLCGLCRSEADLVESHLIPRAFYKLARTPERTNPNPVVVYKGKAKTTSKQVKEHFLCSVCEDRFNKGGENFTLKWCSRGSSGFKLGEVAEELPTIGETDHLQIKGLGANEAELAGKLGYFAASVFWRASARSWHYQGRTILPISLGPYENEFREYLLGKSAYPEHAELFIHVSSDQPAGNWTFSPSKSIQSGKTRHKFCVPGIIFTLYVGKAVPKESVGFSLAPAAMALAYGSFAADDWYVVRSREAIEAEKGGSLGRD